MDRGELADRLEAELADKSSGTVCVLWSHDVRAVLQALRRQPSVEECLAALKPFADAAENMDGDEPDTMSLWESPEAMMLTFGDLRKARQIAALYQEKGEG